MHCSYGKTSLMLQKIWSKVFFNWTLLFVTPLNNAWTTIG